MDEAALSVLRRLDAGTELNGLVRLSVGRVLAERFLIERLRAFHERYPAIDLEVIGRMRVTVRLCRIEFSVHTALPIAQAPAGVRRLQRAWIERKEAERRDILKSDAFAPFDHSMTSSARPSSGNGIERPSALATCILMTISSFVTC
jgi:DNA-binding transcriptional LysR family regulator